MNHTRKTAIAVGALFLIAMAASLVGAALIESVLGTPDYFANIAADKTQVTAGVFLELINGIAVIGIAVLMFPIFRKVDEASALGYVAFRIVEAMIIFAAVITPLTLITLSQEYLLADTGPAANLQTLGRSFIAVRTHLFSEMLGIFFSLSALLFYILLYQGRLVPRFISVWGLLAVISVFSWNLLELAGIYVSVGLFLALPIILNEIFLGIWLIVKGFDSSRVAPKSAKPIMKVV